MLSGGLSENKLEKKWVDLVDEEEHLARDDAELEEHVGNQELVLAEILRSQCPSLISIYNKYIKSGSRAL